MPAVCICPHAGSKAYLIAQELLHLRGRISDLQPSHRVKSSKCPQRRRPCRPDRGRERRPLRHNCPAVRGIRLPDPVRGEIGRIENSRSSQALALTKMALRAVLAGVLLASAEGFAFGPMLVTRRLPSGASPRPLAYPLPVRVRNSHRDATTMAVGKLGSLMKEPDPPPERVLQAVEKAGGRVTVADVASGAGVSLDEAKKQLTVLAQLARGDLEVSSDGELVYRFGSSFRSELSSRSTKKQIQEAWDKVAPIAFYVLRVSFGA